MSHITKQPDLWFPLHPRFLPLLRLAGGIATLWALYLGITKGQWSAPAILLVWLLVVRAEKRPRTLFYQVGVFAHWLLIIALMLCAAIALTSQIHRS